MKHGILKRAQSISWRVQKNIACHEEKEAASGKISNPNKLISTGVWARKQHREDEGVGRGLSPCWRCRRKLTEPKAMCFGGGMWFGWRPKTRAASETSSIKKFALCSINYMAAFSLKCIFLLFCSLFLLWGKTRTERRLETQTLWVEGTGGAAGMACPGLGFGHDLCGAKISSFFWIKDCSSVLSNNICKPPE